LSFSNKQVEEIEKGLRTLSQDEVLTPEGTGSLMRTFHTIKGDSGYFNLETISKEAHEIEDFFQDCQKEGPLPEEEKFEEVRLKILQLKNGIKRMTQKVREISGLEGDEAEARGTNSHLMITLPINRVNRLLEWTRVHDLSLKDSKMLLLKKTEELKSVPFGRLFNRFPQMVKRLAERLQKKVNPLKIEGAQIRINCEVLDSIGDSLVHLVRNAVDHGIEDHQVRKKKGKEETGNIFISAQKDSKLLTIRVEDDGGGIDTDRLVEKSAEKKLISKTQAENLSMQDKIHLIFHPGLSSKNEITDLSGRGVGMDVVKTEIEKLGGEIEVVSQRDFGSKFKLSIPLAES